MPYKNLTIQQVLIQVPAGHRLVAPPNCPEEIEEIMTMCWVDEPSNRPNFDNLAIHFESMVSGGTRGNSQARPSGRPEFVGHNYLDFSRDGSVGLSVRSPSATLNISIRNSAASLRSRSRNISFDAFREPHSTNDFGDDTHIALTSIPSVSFDDLTSTTTTTPNDDHVGLPLVLNSASPNDCNRDTRKRKSIRWADSDSPNFDPNLSQRQAPLSSRASSLNIPSSEV